MVGGDPVVPVPAPWFAADPLIRDDLNAEGRHEVVDSERGPRVLESVDDDPDLEERPGRRGVDDHLGSPASS